jgi:hypothetical protein
LDSWMVSIFWSHPIRMVVIGVNIAMRHFSWEHC